MLKIRTHLFFDIYIFDCIYSLNISSTLTAQKSIKVIIVFFYL